MISIMAEFFIDRNPKTETTKIVLANKQSSQKVDLQNSFCLNCPVKGADGGCSGLDTDLTSQDNIAQMSTRVENLCGIINNPEQTMITRERRVAEYDEIQAVWAAGVTPDPEVIERYHEGLRRDIATFRRNVEEEEMKPFDPNFISLIDEWVNPEDEEEKIRLQQTAEKHQLTILQLAKIEAGVWLGTYTPAKYGDPRALNLVREVAQEIGRDEAVKGVIGDFCDVKFDEGISLEQALTDLPRLKEVLDRRAAEMIGGVLRGISPDSVIVDRRKADEAIRQEFRHDKDEF